MMLKFISNAVLNEAYGLYTRYGREEALPVGLVGTEFRSFSAQSEIACMAPISEDIFPRTFEWNQ